MTAIDTRERHARRTTPPRPTIPPPRGLPAGLVALAAGLVALAVLGPLTGGPVRYAVSATLRAQTIGLDAFSLAVVTPLALAAAVLVRRRHVAGPLLAMGIGAYTAYMLLQYVVGPEYLARPGNSQRLFPLELVVFTLGWAIAVAGWTATPESALPRSHRRERRLGRLVLPVLAALAFVRYVPALADAMAARPASDSYTAGPTFFWVIALLDLGVFLPLTVLTCAGLAGGRNWARKPLYLLAGWFALVGAAVSAMAVAMQIEDVPAATTGSTISMLVLGALFVALAGGIFRPLFAHRPRVVVELEPDAVLLRLRGLAAVAALRRKVRVPFTAIDRVEGEPVYIPPSWRRLTGSALPFTDLRAGLLRTPGGWGFYCCADRHHAITLHVSGVRMGVKVATVVLPADDPAGLTGAIRARIRR